MPAAAGALRACWRKGRNPHENQCRPELQGRERPGAPPSASVSPISRSDRPLTPKAFEPSSVRCQAVLQKDRSVGADVDAAIDTDADRECCHRQGRELEADAEQRRQSDRPGARPGRAAGRCTEPHATSTTVAPPSAPWDTFVLQSKVTRCRLQFRRLRWHRLLPARPDRRTGTIR